MISYRPMNDYGKRRGRGKGPSEDLCGRVLEGKVLEANDSTVCPLVRVAAYDTNPVADVDLAGWEGRRAGETQRGMQTMCRRIDVLLRFGTVCTPKVSFSLSAGKL